jgi:hypothetical protein
MATGRQALQHLRTLIKGQPAGCEQWIDIIESYDLGKLKVSDLVSESFDPKLSETISSDLLHGNVASLGNALGISLHVKFRATADRDNSACTIKADTSSNAEWLRAYVVGKFPQLQPTDVTMPKDANQYQFSVHCPQDTPLWKLQDALLQCPAVVWVRMFATRVRERPHYLIQPYNLAAWITDQGEERWWRVDGDSLLMSRLEFPCPPDELAKELQRINKPLLALDPEGVGDGTEVIPEEISRLLETEELGVPSLTLSWQNGNTDWLLIEDQPTKV